MEALSEAGQAAAEMQLGSPCLNGQYGADAGSVFPYSLAVTRSECAAGGLAANRCRMWSRKKLIGPLGIAEAFMFELISKGL